MSRSQTLEFLFKKLHGCGEQAAIIEASDQEPRIICCEDVAARASALAAGLAEDGIGREDRIALFAEPGIDWITLLLGILRRGATAVPLDTQLEKEQLSRILEDGDITLVVADGKRAERLRSIDFTGRVVAIDADADTEATAGEGESWHRWLGEEVEPPEFADAEDVALLLYTSGTTGAPKGVPLKQCHLAFQVQAVADTGLVSADDRMLQPLPLHHVYPLVVGTLAPLALGVPIVIPQALTGPKLIAAIKEQAVTIILGVPRLYSALLAAIDRRIDGQILPLRVLLRGLMRLCESLRATTGLNAGPYLLRPLHRQLGVDLRMLASGGSPLKAATARRLEGIGWDLAVGYGLTETSPLLTIKLPGQGHLDTVGRAIEGIELRIDESVETSCERDSGEILARGGSVFDGYLDLDEKTDAVFTEDGWFRTGDLGWLDEEGFLHLLGRKSTMLVTASGENIRTEALEEHYAEHPLIEEIGILMDDEQLAAVVFPNMEALRQDARGVRNAVGEALREQAESRPSYQQLDRFRVSREALDRTRLDKIRRGELEQRYKSLGSEEGQDTKGPVDVEEMDTEDRRLLRDDAAQRAWKLLADRYQDMHLTPDTDFQLELGVDSLGWLDLSMDIAQRTGVELSDDDIAEIQTVRDMLQRLAGREPPGEDMETPLQEPSTVLSKDQKKWLEPRSAPLRFATSLLYRLNGLLMKILFRVRARGEAPQAEGPLVLTPNHASFLDPFALAAVLPPAMRARVFWGGLTAQTHRNALFRAGSRLGRVIPIDPKRTVISSLAFAKAILLREQVLVWFPEGQRSPDNQLLPLQAGIGALLQQVKEATVVPIHIEGSFEAWPRGRRLPRLRPIAVRFGPELSVESLAQQGSGDCAREKIISGLRHAMREVASGKEVESGNAVKSAQTEEAGD